MSSAAIKEAARGAVPERIRPATPARDVPSRSAPSRLAIFAGIVLGLLLIYHANGDFLPGRDSVTNAWLPVAVLNDGQMAFRPSRMPYLFDWQLADTKENLRFARWDQVLAPSTLASSTPESSPPATSATGGEPPAGSSMAELYRARKLVLRGPGYYLFPSRLIDGRTGERLYANTFGPGAGLTALPVFASLRLVARDLRAHPKLVWYAAKFTASLLVAVSAGLLYLTMLRFTPARVALLSTLAFGLGTCVWSTSSQALWQHGPSEFWLALALFFVVRDSIAPLSAAAGGTALAMAVACRPTNAVVLAIMALWLAFRDWRALVAILVGALPIGFALAVYNGIYLGSPLSFGQTEIAEKLALHKCGAPGVWQTPLWRGAAGLLASPGRGLFIYSPWLLLAVAGAVIAWRDPRYAPLRPLPLAALAILAVHAKFYDWWGGWAFGYRPIVDATVLLAPLAAAALAALTSEQGSTARRRLAWSAFALLVAWSIGVQTLGAFAYDLAGWNGRVVAGVSQDIDRPEFRHRIWSWRDNPILFYATHFTTSQAERARRVQAMCEQPG
jgi:hypothetical protein